MVVENERKRWEGVDDGFELSKYKLDRPDKIRINFNQRTFQNKIFLIVYRCLRFFNVSIWIYFLPTVALLMQFALPIGFGSSSDE